ncbi:MAG: ribulose-phosphate 3-epimerase [Leucobacter sp.]
MEQLRINPSILAADFVNLQAELERISTADFVHLDVMDNHFVPNLTMGPPIVSRIREVSPIPLDMHLMLDDSDRWAPEYAELGAQSVTFHAEATENPVALARKLRDMGARAGIALNPGTDPEPYLELLPEFDQVLVMTVEPGFGGQTFMFNMMAKLSRFAEAKKKLGLDVWLQVDGGVSLDTIGIAAEAGADTFVAGSAVYRGEPEDRIAELRAAAANGHAH